mgnify:FL=1
MVWINGAMASYNNNRMYRMWLDVDDLLEAMCPMLRPMCKFYSNRLDLKCENTLSWMEFYKEFYGIIKNWIGDCNY